MKRLLIGLGLPLAALVTVVLGRALMAPVHQPSTATAPASKFDADLVAAHLAEAVKFRTISWQAGAPPENVAASQAAFVAMRDWIAATYPQFAKTATLEIVGDYSLLFTWPGSDPSLKPVLLMSHLDVVPIAPGSEGTWTQDPFAGVIADGFIWGRGTIDVKSGVVGQLEAAEALIASGFKPKRTILFAFGHDEEVGGVAGSAKIAEHLAARGTKLEFVNDEGGAISQGIIPGVASPVALVGIAEKGYVTLELTAQSAGGHSSLPPPVETTAIGRLARAIGRIADTPFESKIDGVTHASIASIAPAMPFFQRMATANLWLFEPIAIMILERGTPAAIAGLRTTIAPTIVSGGNKENVLPPDATATINFRVHPRDTIEDVVAHVRNTVDDQAVKITVNPGGREASPVVDIEGPQFALIKRVLETVKPGVVVAPNLLPGATDSRYFQPLTENIFRFLPVILTPDDLNRFHGTNERISIANMQLIADYYHTLITSLDELPATDEPPPT